MTSRGYSAAARNRAQRLGHRADALRPRQREGSTTVHRPAESAAQ